MPRHAEIKTLPYSAVQMYDLVADVARYPEFLPWNQISAMRLIKAPQSETYYLEAKRDSKQFFRYLFFGMPKYDLPVNALPNGKEGFLDATRAISPGSPGSAARYRGRRQPQ